MFGSFGGNFWPSENSSFIPSPLHHGFLIPHDVCWEKTRRPFHRCCKTTRCNLVFTKQTLKKCFAGVPVISLYEFWWGEEEIKTHTHTHTTLKPRVCIVWVLMWIYFPLVCFFIRSVTCGVGTYHDTEQGRCTLCPPGTYQDVEGQLLCEGCPGQKNRATPRTTGARSVTECGGETSQIFLS